MRLSDELLAWRADRPDEWKMDEFIRMAKRLEADAVENEICAIRKFVSRYESIKFETIRKGGVSFFMGDYCQELRQVANEQGQPTAHKD